MDKKTIVTFPKLDVGQVVLQHLSPLTTVSLAAAVLVFILQFFYFLVYGAREKIGFISKIKIIEIKWSLVLCPTAGTVRSLDLKFGLP
jgi:hypothetical protein